MALNNDPTARLGKRERQIMEILYRRERATAAEVLGDLPDAVSNSAVRGMLRHLEEKGLVRHEWEGPRYVFLPTSPASAVRTSALSHVVGTFFNGSVSTAIATLLSSEPLSQKEYDRLSRLIEDARDTGEDE